MRFPRLGLDLAVQTLVLQGQGTFLLRGDQQWWDPRGIIQPPDVKERSISVVSKPKSARWSTSSARRSSNNLPARRFCVSGANGANPAAMRSALRNSRQCTKSGRNSEENVVLPAPFGPAMTYTVGFRERFFPTSSLVSLCGSWPMIGRESSSHRVTRSITKRRTITKAQDGRTKD